MHSVLNLAYFVGVALIGAGAAALVLHIAWAQFSRGDPPIIVVVIAATLGAVAATQLQRLVIIVASAFGGAWTLLVGVLALMGDKAARAAAAADDVWVLYPLSAGGGRKWVLPVWLVLAIVGTIVQLKGAAVRRASRRRHHGRRRDKASGVANQRPRLPTSSSQALSPSPYGLSKQPLRTCPAALRPVGPLP